jgi:hypothetical protein
MALPLREIAKINCFLWKYKETRSNAIKSAISPEKTQIWRVLLIF